MDTNASELTARSMHLFTRRAPLESLWQELAWNFYPERADFTALRTTGTEYADHLFESVPAQYRRDLASAMGAILRPRSRSWFKMRSGDQRDAPMESIGWLDQMTDVTRSHLYATYAGFQRAMKEADNDFVAFGNAVTSVTPNRFRDGLQFRTWHLRDVAWADDYNGDVNYVARKFKLTLKAKAEQFGHDKLSKQEAERFLKTPFEEVEIYQVCLPVTDYDPYTKNLKWKKFEYVCVYFCPISKVVLQENGYTYFPFHIRRWATTSNSAYGYSQASALGLVDARLLQSQAQIILEAGEKIVDPPTIATRDAVLEGPNIGAGQVTWVDMVYDERLGAALRPFQSGGNIPIGLEMKQDTRQVLSAAFFLNKLNLPIEEEMTATEVSARLEEYIRGAGPVFEPFENDNARLLDTSFQILLEVGAYGAPDTIPEDLQGKDLKFEFDTPIQIAYERKRVAQGQELIGFMQLAATTNPEAADRVNLDRIMLDCGMNISGNSNWFNNDEAVAQIRQGRQEAQMAQQAPGVAQAMKNGVDAIPAMEPAAAALERMDKKSGGKIGQMIQGAMQ